MVCGQKKNTFFIAQHKIFVGRAGVEISFRSLRNILTVSNDQFVLIENGNKFRRGEGGRSSIYLTKTQSFLRFNIDAEIELLPQKNRNYKAHVELKI